jgi:hypothetical protein
VLFAFAGSTLWTLTVAATLERSVQDAWILESLEAPLALAVASYLVAVAASLDLRRFTAISAVMAFLLIAAPALKYDRLYGSTTDVAAHRSLVASIASNGQVERASVYQHTPGFHLVAALLAAMSGTGAEIWLKLVPAFLGTLYPLAYYPLCRRAQLSPRMSRSVIFLSVLSIPLLYQLNGTTFTAPLALSLVAMLVTRDLVTQRHAKRACTLGLMFLLPALVLWHPATSLLLPFIILLSAAIKRLSPRHMAQSTNSSRLVSFAILSLVATLAYWMYDANLVWSHFARNLELALQAQPTPALVPSTLNRLPISDRILIAAVYHARDAMMVLLAGLGTLLLLRPSRRTTAANPLLQTQSAIWLAAITPFLLVLVLGFGNQGYRRFLVYVVAFSPLPAGCALAHISASIRPNRSSPPSAARDLVLYAIVCLAAFGQIYPYQPAVPAAEESPGEPIVWLHQVNTHYQAAMLTYAAEHLPPDRQLVSDYIGSRQRKLFGGTGQSLNLRLASNQKPEAAYLLLHWPGEAGAYAESLPLRTRDAIQAWRRRPGMNTVYDNGGSFILFYPDNTTSPFRMGWTGE